MNIKSLFSVMAVAVLSITSAKAQYIGNSDPLAGIGLHIDASIGPRINLGELRDIDNNSCDFSFNAMATFNRMALSMGSTRTIGTLHKDITDDGLRMFDGESYKITTLDMKIGFLHNIGPRIYVLPMFGWNVGGFRYQGEMEYYNGGWEEFVPCDVEDFCIVARPGLLASFEIGHMLNVVDDGAYVSWGLKGQVRQVRLHPDERNYDNYSYSISLILRFGGSITH